MGYSPALSNGIAKYHVDSKQKFKWTQRISARWWLIAASHYQYEVAVSGIICWLFSTNWLVCKRAVFKVVCFTEHNGMDSNGFVSQYHKHWDWCLRNIHFMIDLSFGSSWIINENFKQFPLMNGDSLIELVEIWILLGFSGFQTHM